MNNDKSAIQVIAGAARCPEYSPSMVKALMKKLETNEKAFALLMNVTPSTVRLWTTGAARPCSMARRLMQIYESGPEIVSKIAGKAARRKEDARRVKRRNKQLLVENEYVKELLAVLKENPSPSGKDFAEMVAHVGELESRLAEAVEELKTMRQELQQVQNRSLKAVLQKSCKSLEDNISNMRQKLAELKDHIIEGCQKALSAFKERGTSALDGLSRFFHVKPMLEGIRKAIDNSIRIDDNAVSKIQTLSAEYHQAGRHLKNMGRTLIGKEPVQEPKAPGRLSKVIAAPYKVNRACMTAAKRNIEKAIGSLGRLQESSERRPSVLRAMQENGEKVQPPAKKAVPAVSKAER